MKLSDSPREMFIEVTYVSEDIILGALILVGFLSRHSSKKTLNKVLRLGFSSTIRHLHRKIVILCVPTRAYYIHTPYHRKVIKCSVSIQNLTFNIVTTGESLN